MTYHEPSYRAGQEKMREEAAKVVEGGRFLHWDAPDAKWARQVAALIRNLPIAQCPEPHGECVPREPTEAMLNAEIEEREMDLRALAEEFDYDKSCNGYAVPMGAATLLAALRRERRGRDAQWIAVPREATSEMIQAMEDRLVEGATYIAETSIQYALWKEVYRAMLRAIPSAPTEASK